MGEGTLAKFGIDIARFLKLDSPERFTSHTFRRSAATIAADNNATGIQLQSHFGWKSAQMAMEYVSNSKPGREAMASMITGDIALIIVLTCNS